MDITRHQKYVEKGYCPSIHTSKAWCCRPAGHGGKHQAPYLLPSGRFILGAEWR